jgi:hypothetical protein
VTENIGKSLDCRRQIPREGLERLSVRPQRAPLASQVAQYLPAYLLPPKPFGGLTKCLFPRNTEVLKQVMVIAFGDLIMHAALARARHPTGLTIARIKTTSRLICTRRSAGVRSSRIFGPRRGLRTIKTDMVGSTLDSLDQTAPCPDRAGSTGPELLHAQSIVFPA